MGSYSRSVDGNNSKQSSYAADSDVCQVCKGMKYILVATTKLNHTSTVYERQVCPACSMEPSSGANEAESGQPHNGKKALSGTGYLRNKKRRRKASS